LYRVFVVKYVTTIPNGDEIVSVYIQRWCVPMGTTAIDKEAEIYFKERLEITIPARPQCALSRCTRGMNAVGLYPFGVQGTLKQFPFFSS
jgi:hypothetical protein